MRVILGFRPTSAVEDIENGCADIFGGEFAELPEEVVGACTGVEREGDLAKNGAGVQPAFHLNEGDSRFMLLLKNGALDRRGAAVLRQQRCMDIDTPERRRIQHPLFEQLTEIDHHQHLGAHAFQFGKEGVAVDIEFG